MIKLATCKTNHAIEPYKYYAYVGEHIYVYDDQDMFLHRRTDKIDPIVSIFQSPGFTDNIRVSGECDFDECFHRMVNSGQTDSHFDEHFEALKRMSKKPPIIIGGCGRSGTTLLLSILGAHSSIHAFPDELFAFYPKPYRIRNILNALDEQGYNSDRWCEKTPKNVMAFKEINEMFEENVRIIHMIRDGRDVVTSFHPNHPYKKYWVDTDRWVSDVSKGLECSDIAYTLKYEHLVEDPAKTLRSVCDFIEEPFEESLLNHTLGTTVKDNPAWEDGVKAIHTKRVGKWQKPEHAERVESFMADEKAHELMSRLRYI
jgi:hypothetical protein